MLLVMLLACAEAPTFDTATCEVGNAVGDCAPELTLLDQAGDARSLSDSLGRVVVIEFGEMW